MFRVLSVAPVLGQLHLRVLQLTHGVVADHAGAVPGVRKLPTGSAVAEIPGSSERPHATARFFQVAALADHRLALQRARWIAPE